MLLEFPRLLKHATRYRLAQFMWGRLNKPCTRTVHAVDKGNNHQTFLPGRSEVMPLQCTCIDDTIQEPVTCTIEGATNFEYLTVFAYPDLVSADSTPFATLAILAPENKTTNQININVLELIPTTLH